ncbi:TerB family tellurite resistance protein, partial [Rhizobium ruizarguesonis]
TLRRVSGSPSKTVRISSTRRKVAFSVAIIALSAKMAKADGIVSEKEVEAFSEIFEFPKDQAKNVARLYNLARKDVAGYEAY